MNESAGKKRRVPARLASSALACSDDTVGRVSGWRSRAARVRRGRAKSRAEFGTVLFVNAESWHCFDQLAAVLGRRGVRTVRVLATEIPRSRIDRLTDRFVYGETVNVHDPEGVDRLEAIVTTEPILDLQVNEREYLAIPYGSRSWSLLASADPSWRRRGHLYDKAVLAQVLDDAGVGVPKMLHGAATSPEEALVRLGAPMMVKARFGTGGSEVRIVGDAPSANTAIDDLTGDANQVFFQEYLDGDLLGYGGVFRGDEPVQQLTAIEHKSLSDPLGPTARAQATIDGELQTSGRRARDALGTRGFFAAEFLRAPDGHVVCIDVCTRAWGSFLCWTGAGLDLVDGYLYALGVTGTLPASAIALQRETVTVFPAGLLDTFERGTWPATLRATCREVYRYAPTTGIRYCALATTRLLVQRVRARRGKVPTEPLRGGGTKVPWSDG